MTISKRYLKPKKAINGIYYLKIFERKLSKDSACLFFKQVVRPNQLLRGSFKREGFMLFWNIDLKKFLEFKKNLLNKLILLKQGQDVFCLIKGYEQDSFSHNLSINLLL
ncbi:hypothetical protein BpHYR1_049031 [Brachionus plicatilis]|uniref:Uncharacterized protein n=1 Tax=Brachionus plicatilis TaxID=10195 RepID=A0A3M7S6C1_BRAPC|nr:hypothetical protein BpHYR1_049031 [Brachionus plicatilis]